MKIFENIINHKINMITAEELLNYARQFKISIKREHAHKIANYLNGKQFNLFDSTQRAAIIKEISKIAGPETAKGVNKLFLQFTK